MTAIPERAVDDEFARLGSKNFEDLTNHDRTMGARRRLSSGNDLGRGAGIELRRELFVLLRKMSGVFAFVSGSPVGPFGIHSFKLGQFHTAPPLSISFRLRAKLLLCDHRGRERADP